MDSNAVLLFACYMYIVMLQASSVECSYYHSYSNNITTSDQEATVAGIILGVLFTLGIMISVAVCIALFCCKSKNGSNRLVSHNDIRDSSPTTVTFVTNTSPSSPGQFPVSGVQGPPPYRSLFPGSPPQDIMPQQTMPNSPPPMYSET
ncbi:cysteine and tyrosine-rich protein 1-like [Saccostrea echinata]|uniref:cysteine and tyrosine-rich protein 1-like n=1 Tax=Saccostrea echinata TaxID=191078 RepID=UPI002A810D9C|nr:cysteine and tyrosine-rich protein 1-like [Saccostrea echinata]